MIYRNWHGIPLCLFLYTYLIYRALGAFTKKSGQKMGHYTELCQKINKYTCTLLTFVLHYDRISMRIKISLPERVRDEAAQGSFSM